MVGDSDSSQNGAGAHRAAKHRKAASRHCAEANSPHALDKVDHTTLLPTHCPESSVEPFVAVMQSFQYDFLTVMAGATNERGIVDGASGRPLADEVVAFRESLSQQGLSG